MLWPLATLAIPQPSVEATSSGVLLSWHDHGLSIEMRVRDLGVWAHITDARGDVAPFRGTDNDTVARVLKALGVLEVRHGR